MIPTVTVLLKVPATCVEDGAPGEVTTNLTVFSTSSGNISLGLADSNLEHQGTGMMLVLVGWRAKFLVCRIY